jgi:hypothetical protein
MQGLGRVEAIKVAGELAQLAVHAADLGESFHRQHRCLGHATRQYRVSADSASLLLALLYGLRARTGIVVMNRVVHATGFDGPGCDSQELCIKPLASLQVVSLL